MAVEGILSKGDQFNEWEPKALSFIDIIIRRLLTF